MTASPARNFRGSGDPILIVEDDEDYRDYLRRTLEAEGLRCSPAGTLREAKRRLAGAAPRMVLLDAHLPDGSGLDFCRDIREDPRLAHVPVAVLTGKTRVSGGGEWLDAGADTCWTKPVGPRRLAALVRGLLRRCLPDGDSFGSKVGGLALDRLRRVVSYCGLASRELSPREIRFFELLIEAHPGMLTREWVRRSLFDGRDVVCVDLALNEFLRRFKLKLPKPLAEAVQTIYRRGFRLDIPA